MGDKKGMGSRLNNSITLDKRVKLFDWCKEHKEDRRPFDEMAVSASGQLGFSVSMSCMANHWAACNGSRRTHNSGSKMAEKIELLETRIAQCERRLSEAGA